MPVRQVQESLLSFGRSHDRQYVSLRVTLHTIERAECAKFFAHIRVIDIAIDDVADHVIRVQTLTNAVRAESQIEKIGFLKSLMASSEVIRRLRPRIPESCSCLSYNYWRRPVGLALF